MNRSSGVYATEITYSQCTNHFATSDRSSPSAYEFYEETLNLMIVMSSTQLQHPSAEPSEKNYFLNLVLEKFRYKFHSHFKNNVHMRIND